MSIRRRNRIVSLGVFVWVPELPADGGVKWQPQTQTPNGSKCFPYKKRIVLKCANVKSDVKCWLRWLIGIVHIDCLADSADFFFFLLMFTESLCLHSIKVSVNIPLPFILYIFPTECHIDLMPFDCGSSSWNFYCKKKKKTAGLIKAKGKQQELKEPGNNQSDGTMLEERLIYCRLHACN